MKKSVIHPPSIDYETRIVIMTDYAKQLRSQDDIENAEKLLTPEIISMLDEHQSTFGDKNREKVDVDREVWTAYSDLPVYRKRLRQSKKALKALRESKTEITQEDWDALIQSIEEAYKRI
jgi:hypothetical protein